MLPYATKNLIDDIIPSSGCEGLEYLAGCRCYFNYNSSRQFFFTDKAAECRGTTPDLLIKGQGAKKITDSTHRFFDNNKSGALVSRVMTDVEGVRNLVGTGLGSTNWRLPDLNYFPGDFNKNQCHDDLICAFCQ